MLQKSADFTACSILPWNKAVRGFANGSPVASSQASIALRIKSPPTGKESKYRVRNQTLKDLVIVQVEVEKNLQWHPAIPEVNGPTNMYHLL